MSNSNIYQLRELRDIIVSMLIEEGRVSNIETICEYCLNLCPDNKWEIHHTRYKDATYQDLMVVCRSCNRISENKGLT